MMILLFRWLFPLALLSAVSCDSAPIPYASKSAQEPHRAESGPWFEGWYARATDLGGNRSIAVIVGTHRPRGTEAQNNQAMPGYIGILYSEGDNTPTRSWTYFPSSTRITVDGKEPQQNPNIFQSKDKNFRWEADELGYFSANELAISIPGEIELHMQFEGGQSWDQSGLPLGPESYLAGLPVPLHWYVKSLNAPSNYSLKFTGADGHIESVSGQSRTHLEKNWGKVFPKQWYWLQADAVTENAQIVVGSGVVGLGPLDLKAMLAGYRSPKEAWNLRFSDPGTHFEIQAGACQGPFRLKAKRWDLAVEINAYAPRSSFGSVAVPTADGFVADFGAESFSARIEVITSRRGLRGMYETDRRVFKNGALEFGAGAYNKDCSAKMSDGQL